MRKEITRREVEQIIIKYQVRMGHFVIIDGLIHTTGDVLFLHKNLTKIPLHFGRVDGDFIVKNLKLQSLKGCPIYVGGNFNCRNNDLKSLSSGPEIVRGSYDCCENKLTSLIGCARTIGFNLLCHNNNLVTLKGSPKKITGFFNCKMNRLKSINGCPKEIIGRLDVSNNFITNLFKSNIPKPEFKFFGELFITCNFLNNLKGIPKDFEGTVYLDASTKSLNYENFEVTKMKIKIRTNNSFGFSFMPKQILENYMHADILIRYQYFYEIWSEDDELILEPFNEFFGYIKDGLT